MEMAQVLRQRSKKVSRNNAVIKTAYVGTANKTGLM